MGERGSVDYRTCRVCGQIRFGAGPCRVCNTGDPDGYRKYVEELVEAQNQAYWARGEKNEGRSGK